LEYTTDLIPAEMK